jgi:hypothetical protein
LTKEPPRENSGDQENVSRFAFFFSVVIGVLAQVVTLMGQLVMTGEDFIGLS